MKKVLITLVAAAFLCAFAVPAAAQTEWSFYGSVRVETFSYDDDAQSPPAPNAFDDRDTTWSLLGGSRFGADAKAGDVSGRIELRQTGEWRVVWGEWDFGFGKLGVGKHYTPANMFYSQQAGFGDAGLLDVGGYYTGAKGMLRLRFQGIADMFDFDLALVDPQDRGGGLVVDDRLAAGRGQDAGTIRDLDISLPQLEARMLFNWGPMQMEFGGAWSKFKETYVITNAERRYSVTAWGLHFGIKYAAGPFYINGNVHTGQNNSYLGQWVADAARAWYYAPNDAVIDSDRWGWQLVAGFNLNDMIAFEAGYGQAKVDYNDPRVPVAGVTFVDNKVAAYYIQTRISPYKGVTIIPEIGKKDYKNDILGADEGDTTYFGVYWRISY